jgi:Ca2+-binding EF-hand superfamily protein
MEDLKQYYFPPGTVHQLDEKKFISLTVRLNCGLKELEAKELFYFLDVNGTGYISINEFLLTLMPDAQKISDVKYYFNL